MLGALSLTLLASLPALQAKEAEPTLLWRGKVHRIEADGTGLPEELGPDARSALELWTPRARRWGLELALTEDELVLLCIHENRKKTLETVEEAAAMVNALLPVPERGAGPQKRRVRIEHADGSWEESWSYDDTHEHLGRGTAVLLEMREGDHYEALLRSLTSEDPTLKEWARTVRNQYGFSIPRILTAAWIAGGRINEEWSANSEIVHRTVGLLLYRNFGELPFWFQLGLCWHVEMELCDGVWCFPYRDGFVWASEHSGWSRTLASRMRRRPKQPYSLEDVTCMTRKVVRTSESDIPYRDEYLLTWGTLRALAWNEDLSIELSKLCEALREHRLENGRRWVDKENWELIIGYRIPTEEQVAIFESVLGEDVWSVLDAALRKGAPKPSPSSS
jgi:hypothetical protein